MLSFSSLQKKKPKYYKITKVRDKKSQNYFYVLKALKQYQNAATQ